MADQCRGQTTAEELEGEVLEGADFRQVVSVEQGFTAFIDGYDFKYCRKYNAIIIAGPSLASYLPLRPAIVLTP